MANLESGSFYQTEDFRKNQENLRKSYGLFAYWIAEPSDTTNISIVSVDQPNTTDQDTTNNGTNDSK